MAPATPQFNFGPPIQMYNPGALRVFVTKVAIPGPHPDPAPEQRDWGGGRTEEIYGWAQINFTLIFEREDQKKEKGFILAVFHFSGHKSFFGARDSWKHVHCLAGRSGI